MFNKIGHLDNMTLSCATKHAILGERERERKRPGFSKLFAKFELPLFGGHILQFVLHCNTMKGGWEFPQDSF